MFDSALELNRNDIRCWLIKVILNIYFSGVVLIKLGKENEALIIYDLALSINPKDSNALTNKGIRFTLSD